MITAMRKGAAGWVAKILFVVLIISFGAWGIVDYLQPDPDPVVITVGDTEVRQSWNGCVSVSAVRSPKTWRWRWGWTTR